MTSGRWKCWLDVNHSMHRCILSIPFTMCCHNWKNFACAYDRKAREEKTLNVLEECFATYCTMLHDLCINYVRFNILNRFGVACVGRKCWLRRGPVQMLHILYFSTPSVFRRWLSNACFTVAIAFITLKLPFCRKWKQFYGNVEFSKRNSISKCAFEWNAN